MEDRERNQSPREGGPSLGELERRLTADGTATLYSPAFDQTFHSRHGAARESRHVFLGESGVGQMLQSGMEVRVLEVGFGSGLNFLLTAEAARQAGTTVRYLALERELLPARLVSRLGFESLATAPLRYFLAFRRSLPETPPTGVYHAAIPGAALELRLGDARAATLEEDVFDAVYHDGFSPDANPEVWSAAFLSSLAAAMKPGGALVTYTVKGVVRRCLTEAGLAVEKLPGPAGGKREMLRAIKPVKR